MRDIILAAAFAVTAAPAHAVGFSVSELTLGYNKLPAGRDMIESGDIGVTGAFSFGEKVTLGLGLSYSDAGHRAGSTNTTVVSLLGDYSVGDHAVFGVFMDYTHFNFSGFSSWSTAYAKSKFDVYHYGLHARYSLGNMGLSGFLGQGKSSDVSYNTNVLGIAASYGFASGLDIGAFYNREELRNGATNDDFDNFGVSVGQLLSASSKMPLYLSTSIGRYELNSNEVGQLRISLTLPLGNSATVGRKELHRHSSLISYISQTAGQ